MAAKSIPWVVEFEGHLFDIHLFASGEAIVKSMPDKEAEDVVNPHLPPRMRRPTDKFSAGDYPLSIPPRVAEKMRKVAKIKNAEANRAARGAVDDALMALFVSQVVPRIRRAE